MLYIDDLKYAVRLLLKKPGFTMLTILVMATGIGLSLYLFSFLHTMMFKPLPFEDGDSLLQISASKNGKSSNDELNLHDLHEIRNEVKGLQEFSSFSRISLNVSGKEGTRRYSGFSVEPNIFKLTRTKPILGREFSREENRAGAELVTIIGYDLWQNQFNGSPEVIDQTLRINGDTYRIVGVMPENYYFPNNADLWVPLGEEYGQNLRDDASSIYGLAHIEDGFSKSDVNKQLGIIMQRLENKYPNTNSGIGAYVETIQKTTVGDGIAVIYSLQVVAVLILLLASINVGNLLLSRALERGKETAIRVAMGAPRLRLISQMLWESMLICLIGGIVGLIVISWGLEITEDITKSFFADRPRFWWKFGIDAYTIKLFLGFVFLTILVTGFLPAWRNSGTDFNLVLRDGTRGALGRKTGRLNRVLVISEIFISLTVLITAGVMSVGTYKATHADLGAETENILSAKINLASQTYALPQKQTQFIKTLESRLENTTGIDDVMIVTALPGESASVSQFVVDGNEYIGNGERKYPKSNYILLTPGTLSKLGVELKAGRYLNTADDKEGSNSIIVTDSFVSRHLLGDSGNYNHALGKRIGLISSDTNLPEWLTIVGIVEHTTYGRVNTSEGRTPSIFRPYSQAPQPNVTIAMKLNSKEETAIHSLRKTLQALDPDLPAFRIEPYSVSLSRYTAPMKFISTVFLLFGIAAAILAVSGIYGVMSNTINQRTQEIGIKYAIGATDNRILKDFLKIGLSQFLWGGTLGFLAGAGMGTALSKIMGTGSTDLLIITSVLTVCIGSVVLYATYLPTKRALDMGPNNALRYE